MVNRDIKWLAVILLLAALAGAGWYFRDELLPAPEQRVEMPSAPVEVETGNKESPDYPVLPVDAEGASSAEAEPLPPLDDSDTYFLLAVVDALGADIEVLLVKDAIIDRFVATIDNLPRPHVAEKIRPAGRLPEGFRVDASGEYGPFYLGPDNYRRYDALVAGIAAADANAIVDTYRRFYPLFQQSYERLGYPDAYFNDRVVEVIDHLLAAPQANEPIRLLRPHVLYKFADPQLEALSSGQKLLLRVGPENAAIVKDVLRELRAELAR
jgi:hypothetical protein